MKSADMSPEQHIAEAKTFVGLCDYRAAQTHALVAIAQYLGQLVRPEFDMSLGTPALEWTGGQR